MDLEQKCDHFYISRIQREANKYIDIEDQGQGYYKVGCYACDGNNKTCNKYAQLVDYGFIMNECQDIDLEE